MKLRQILPFIILMDSGGGVTSKCPDYIMEKLLSCEDTKAYRLLDEDNLIKLYKWLVKWNCKNMFSEDELHEMRLMMRIDE